MVAEIDRGVGDDRTRIAVFYVEIVRGHSEMSHDQRVVSCLENVVGETTGPVNTLQYQVFSIQFESPYLLQHLFANCNTGHPVIP